MLPVWTLGLWQVHSYRLATVVAVVVAGTFAFRRLLRLGRPSALLLQIVLLTVAAGYAATYLAATLATRLHAGSGPTAGISFVWALLGGTAVFVATCWRHDIPVGRACDLVAPALPLGLAIGRLGCFAAGCCYGRPTTSPLGLLLPDDHGAWAVRYPTQLWAAAANLLIFVTLLVVERRAHRPFAGLLALLYIALYSLKRFGLAFLRDSGTSPLLGPFSGMHLTALAGLLAATALFAWNLVRNRRVTVP